MRSVLLVVIPRPALRHALRLVRSVACSQASCIMSVMRNMVSSIHACLHSVMLVIIPRPALPNALLCRMLTNIMRVFLNISIMVSHVTYEQCDAGFYSASRGASECTEVGVL
jgi:hypothetical protein